MRYGLLASLALAALIVAAPASFAFEIQHTSNGSSGGVNFANNPDSQANNMSANLAGESGTGPMLQFGNSTLQFSGGNGGSNADYGMSPAYREQFMGGPGQIGNAISPR
jgi:hypothetical protein